MAKNDIKLIWQDIEKWLNKNAPDRASELMPGADDVEIAKVAKITGYSLPDDYAESLGVHDGEADLSDYTYLSIETAMDTWKRLKKLEQEGAFADRSIDDPKTKTIKPVWWHSAWFPFAKDSGGNLFCVDLEPGPQGTRGQVVRFERSMGPATTEWQSFTKWLCDYRDRLHDGTYAVDEDGFIQDAS
ncbi:MAG TPA: SMI1/KNR4 family protein [Sphingomicrobium sp.]|nr:SMI1/KNR4 family protein [Sphingomicrobium sp.]